MDCPTHGQLNPDWTSCPFCIREQQLRTRAPQAPAFPSQGYPAGGGGGGGAAATQGGFARGGGGFAPAGGGDAGVTRGGGGYAPGGGGGGDAGVTRGAGGGFWPGSPIDETHDGYSARGYGSGGDSGHTRIIDPPESAKKRIRAWLIEKEGPRPDQIFPVKDGTTIIGRDRRNEVFIDDDAISSLHAKLWVDDKRVLRLLNVSTTNGTLVNGVRVEAPVELLENDEIKLGTTVLVLKRIDLPIHDEPARPALQDETIVMQPRNVAPGGEA